MTLIHKLFGTLKLLQTVCTVGSRGVLRRSKSTATPQLVGCFTYAVGGGMCFESTEPDVGVACLMDGLVLVW
jgi:hypothetical protein